MKVFLGSSSLEDMSSWENLDDCTLTLEIELCLNAFVDCNAKLNRTTVTNKQNCILELILQKLRMEMSAPTEVLQRIDRGSESV